MRTREQRGAPTSHRPAARHVLCGFDAEWPKALGTRTPGPPKRDLGMASYGQGDVALDDGDAVGDLSADGRGTCMELGETRHWRSAGAPKLNSAASFMGKPLCREHATRADASGTAGKDGESTDGCPSDERERSLGENSAGNGRRFRRFPYRAGGANAQRATVGSKEGEVKCQRVNATRPALEVPKRSAGRLALVSTWYSAMIAQRSAAATGLGGGSRSGCLRIQPEYRRKSRCTARFFWSC